MNVTHRLTRRALGRAAVGSCFAAMGWEPAAAAKRGTRRVCSKECGNVRSGNTAAVHYSHVGLERDTWTGCFVGGAGSTSVPVQCCCSWEYVSWLSRTQAARRRDVLNVEMS